MLTLTIKKEWFDMILSGEKKEEYREIKPYYNSRLPVNFGYVFIDGKLQPIYRFDCNLQKSIEAGHETEILFRNGYRRDSPSFIAKCTLSVGTGNSQIDIKEDNYSCHQFVSVDKDDNVIGYISYSIDWCAMSVSRFGIISFKKGSLEFVKDVYKTICSLFEIYHMNRIDWFAYTDNPATRAYRNFIKKHGGRECGYYRQISKLQDGKLHDAVEFEILASEFIK